AATGRISLDYFPSPRSFDMRIRGCVVSVIVTIAALSGARLNAQQPTQIYACVNPAGQIRVVAGAGGCKSQETPLVWNVDAAGPASTGQEFVRAVAPAGNLTLNNGSTVLPGLMATITAPATSQNPFVCYWTSGWMGQNGPSPSFSVASVSARVNG